MRSYESIQFCDECDKDTVHQGHPHPINPDLVILIECIECGSVNDSVDTIREKNKYETF